MHNIFLRNNYLCSSCHVSLLRTSFVIFRRGNDLNIWKKFAEHGASIATPSNGERREFVGISSSVINLFIHERERHRVPHAGLYARMSDENVV